MDMLSYVWDHAEGKSKQGFSCLTLGWSDGSTFCPLGFRLLSSKRHHVNDTYWDWTWNCHPSSLAYRRREQSTDSKPTVLVSLLQEAQQSKIPARHVVFDSWYTSPALCRDIVSKTGYHCIGLLKNNRTRYRQLVESEATTLTYSSPMQLSQLYAWCRKEEEKEPQKPTTICISKKIHLRIFGAIQVSLGESKGEAGEGSEAGYPLQAKIVFVSAHHHGKKNTRVRSWIAILSTDTTLSSQEIVRLYSKRWDIEVFFKTMKSLLHVEKEYQFRSFDSMIASMTMSFVRYIYLAWHSRQHTDVRTYGELYYQVWDELQDVTFQEAMERVLTILQKIMIDNFPAVAEKIHTLFTLFMQTLPSYTLGRLRYMNCKS
ncbi:MAG: transposase, partial [Caldisericia bacterium]|nr:transposase [Caldisericia bacterium]